MQIVIWTQRRPSLETADRGGLVEGAFLKGLRCKTSKDASAKTHSSRKEGSLRMVLLQHSPTQPLLADIRRIVTAKMGCSEKRDQEAAHCPALYFHHLSQGT